MMELSESVIAALMTVLEDGMTPAIEARNATITDGILLDTPAQILDYMPTTNDDAGGYPIVAIQDLPGNFENDLTHSFESTWGFGIASMIQTSDHRTLAWQLRRYTQVVASVIQADRMAEPSVLKSPPANVMYTKFEGTEPGPLLGDRNPDSPGTPPSSFRSWTWLLISCRRQEQGG